MEPATDPAAPRLRLLLGGLVLLGTLGLAAELTLQRGYARFLVESRNTKMKTTYGVSGPMVIPIDWPAGSMTIRMLKPGDAAAGEVHDAAQAKAALVPKLPKG